LINEADSTVFYKFKRFLCSLYQCRTVNSSDAFGWKLAKMAPGASEHVHSSRACRGRRPKQRGRRRSSGAPN